MSDGLPPLPGPMPSSFDDQEFENEKPMRKAARKIKEEPLIPLGMALTTFAFISSYKALRRGDSKQANRMFRARVAAQGFTVIAMLAGSMYYNKDRQKTAELRKLEEERDSEEKRLKWIRELEARDEEEKAMKARLQKRREEAQAARAKEAAEKETPAGSGAGILARVGLWPKKESQEGKPEETEPAPETAEDAASEKTERKKNPKSSLGDLGQLISSQKKDEPKPKE